MNYESMQMQVMMAHNPWCIFIVEEWDCRTTKEIDEKIFEYKLLQSMPVNFDGIVIIEEF